MHLAFFFFLGLFRLALFGLLPFAEYVVGSRSREILFTLFGLLFLLVGFFVRRCFLGGVFGVLSEVLEGVVSAGTRLEFLTLLVIAVGVVGVLWEGESVVFLLLFIFLWFLDFRV